MRIQPTTLPSVREHVHVEEATLPLAIGVEPYAASYDADEDVDGDGEQVGWSGAITDLRLGVNIVPGREVMMASDTRLMMVGRNNANAYRGPLVPAYINTERVIWI